MLTTQELDAYAKKRVKIHLHAFFHKEQSNIVDIIHQEANQQINEKNRQAIAQIEKEFMESFIKEANDEPKNEQAQLAIILSTIAVLKLLAVRASHDQNQNLFVKTSIPGFYKIVLEMFGAFVKPTFDCPSYLRSIQSNAAALQILSKNCPLNLEWLFSSLILLNSEQIFDLSQELFCYPDKTEIKDEEQLSQACKPTVNAIENQFYRYLSTLESEDRHLIQKLDFVIEGTDALKVENQPEKFLNGEESLIDTQFLQAAGRITLIKLIIAKNSDQAGAFSDVPYAYFYGAAFGVFDMLHRDKDLQMNSVDYLDIINKCMKKAYTIDDFNALQIQILLDTSNVFKIQYTTNSDKPAITRKPLLERFVIDSVPFSNSTNTNLKQQSCIIS